RETDVQGAGEIVGVGDVEAYEIAAVVHVAEGNHGGVVADAQDARLLDAADARPGRCRLSRGRRALFVVSRAPVDGRLHTARDERIQGEGAVVRGSGSE